MVCAAALGVARSRAFSRQKSQLLSANAVRGRRSGWKIGGATSTKHLHRAASTGQLGQSKSQVVPLGELSS